MTNQDSVVVNKGLETPILFLIFRNPSVTRQVFEQIRAIRPKRLYISADGPRSTVAGDAEECRATREVVSNIDWDCEVHTRFLDENLGLKSAVSSAISWFFESESEGIILEYDCLPDPSFFAFCEAMLERYRDEPRVATITGSNAQSDIQRGDGDYYYSWLTGVWGWATWKESWLRWRPYLENYETFLSSGIFDSILKSEDAKKFMIDTYNAVNSGENKTTWAFFYEYAQIKAGAYCIVPNKNLVTNLGFGPDATNAVAADHPWATLPLETLTSMRQPAFFVPCLEADNELVLRAIFAPKIPFYRRAIGFAARRISRLIGR